MSTKLELFIKNKHEELKRVMSDTRISSFLEKHELEEIKERTGNDCSRNFFS